MRKALVVMLVLVGFLAILGAGVAAQYNDLISEDQAVRSQWAQVDNAYQRRMDLVPNLVETVKGAARFEQSTFEAVTRARAQLGRATLEDPTSFKKEAAAQDQFGAVLSRLIAVAEAYPDLKATANFRDLQAQLEGTENRIAVERMRYNLSAQRFNSRRLAFPTSILANLFGGRFAEKPFFEARPGAETPPRVQF